MGLSFEQIKNSRRDLVTVPVVQWEGDVHLKRMSVADRIRFVEFQEQFDKDDSGRIVDKLDAWECTIEMVALSVVDDDGQKIFDNEEAREFLHGETMETVQNLADAVIELNGLGVSDDAQMAASKKK